jgi:hypothetical protein
MVPDAAKQRPVAPNEMGARDWISTMRQPGKRSPAWKEASWMLTKEADLSTLEWTPPAESVVPNCHQVGTIAFTWDDQDETIVPGHHQDPEAAFSWADVSFS